MINYYIRCSECKKETEGLSEYPSTPKECDCGSNKHDMATGTKPDWEAVDNERGDN